MGNYTKKYTQHQLSVIKDYARAIHEKTIKMELMWHNKELIADDDGELAELYLASIREEIESNMEELTTYLKPKEVKNNG